MFVPSSRTTTAISQILFPFQLYLFSQANGDRDGTRCESAILQGYLSSLFSACVRVLTLAKDVLQKPNSSVSDTLGALRESVAGQLICVCLSELYVGVWSREIISFVSSDLSELLTMWVKILQICNVDVGETETLSRRTTFRCVPTPSRWRCTRRTRSRCRSPCRGT